MPALKAMLDNTICPHYGEFADNPAEDIEKIGGIADPLIEVMRDSKSIGRFVGGGVASAARYLDRAGDLKQAFAAGLKMMTIRCAGSFRSRVWETWGCERS